MQMSMRRAHIERRRISSWVRLLLCERRSKEALYIRSGRSFPTSGKWLTDRDWSSQEHRVTESGRDFAALSPGRESMANTSVFAIYNTRDEVERTIDALREIGFRAT